MWYDVDCVARTCTCAAFQFGKKAGYCKHLAALGVGKEGGMEATVTRPRRKTPFVPSTRPTFSQALSALVKTIRLRRTEEAIYWLLYVDSFPDEKVKNGRFRLGRRIFVSCCEDGMSVAVMEAVTKMLWPMTKRTTPLVQLATEVVRICKVPNWWDPSTGGPDYMRHGYLGHLRYVVRSKERDREVLKQAIVDGIAAQDKAGAMGAIDAITGAWDQTNLDFNLWSHRHTPMSCGLTADFLLAIARERKCELAERLAGIHVKSKSALSDDSNFLYHAAWHMAGGECPVAQAIDTVDPHEVTALLEAAREKWEHPEPIPRWCCDGVHSSGDDRRFAGLWPEMFAVCQARAFYGRLDPELEWMPEFYVV